MGPIHLVLRTFDESTMVNDTTQLVQTMTFQGIHLDLEQLGLGTTYNAHFLTPPSLLTFPFTVLGTLPGAPFVNY